MWRNLLFLTVALLSLHAQTELGSITGAIHDLDGRRVPAAGIELRNVATGATRSARTNETGRYTIGGLPPGEYALRVAKAGFTPAELASIHVAVRQTRYVDFTLLVTGGSETVNVGASITELERESAIVGTRITAAQVDNLPLNGRNWASLLPLIAGAVDSGTGDQRSVRFAGHGRDDNSYILDGVDAGGISNQPQRTQVRLSIPTSGIAEFKADASVYPADAPSGTGGQVIVASRTGSNQWHGAAFEYLRNQIFDARDPFSRINAPFRLNQFGGELGGPVLRDRTFFFATVEALTQRLDQTLTGFTPSASFRAAAALRSPAIRSLLDAYPVAGARPQSSDPSIDVFNGQSPLSADETSGMLRIDHQFSTATRAFLRLNADESVTRTPLGNLRDSTGTSVRPLSGVAALTQVLSPRLLNDARLGFNQVFYRSAQHTPVTFTLRVPGFTNVSSSRTRQEDDTMWSLLDQISYSVGRHLIKAGGESRRVHTNPGSSIDGALAYASRDGFAANQLDSASITSALPMKRLRKTQFFGFVQDEYKPQSNVTLTLGVRYSFFNVFHEKDGRAVPFDFYTCGGFCAPGAQFSTPRTNDFDPRLGVAWSPAALRNRTVLRLGIGFYHGDGQLEDQNLPASNDLPGYSLNARQIASLAFPVDPFLAGATGVLSPRSQNRNRKDEYSTQWSVAMQQALPLKLTGTVAYLGNKGTNLQTITRLNVPDPLTGAVSWPKFGITEYRTNDSNSSFHGLQLSLRRNLTRGWLLSVNDLWSHSINDGSAGGGEADAVTPENVFCRSCERASGAFDVRHVLTVNSIYNIPYGGRLFKTLLSGWSLSSIAMARTGRPVNITVARPASSVPGGYNLSQRPDVVPGIAIFPAGGSTVAQWFNPGAFAVPKPGTWGTAGRNLGRGPALAQIDLGLTRRFNLRERIAVEFRTEMFNLLNRAQYGDPSGDITVPAQFGAITSSVNSTPVGSGTPRKMQFMLRVSF